MTALVSTLGPMGGPGPANMDLASCAARWRALTKAGIDQIASESVFALGGPDGDASVSAFRQAAELGFRIRPTVLSPIGAMIARGWDSSARDDAIADAAATLRQLANAGADWVQVNELCLAAQLDQRAKEALAGGYTHLAEAAPSLKLLLVTHSGAMQHNRAFMLTLPVAGLHLDCLAEPVQFADLIIDAPSELYLSLGLIDPNCAIPLTGSGQLARKLELAAFQRGLADRARWRTNPWPTDLGPAAGKIDRLAIAAGADRLILAPTRAFSSEVDTGSRQENPSREELEAVVGFGEKRERSSALASAPLTRELCHMRQLRLLANTLTSKRRPRSRRPMGDARNVVPFANANTGSKLLF